MALHHLASLFLLVSLCSLFGQGQGDPNCSSVFESYGIWVPDGSRRWYKHSSGWAGEAHSWAAYYYGDQFNWVVAEDFRFTTHTDRRCRYVSHGNRDCRNVTIKDQFIEGIDEWHNREKHMIDARRDKNNTFYPRFGSMRMAREQREFEKKMRNKWNKEVGMASALVVLGADYVNLALNTILRTNTSEQWCLPIHFDGEPIKTGKYYWEKEQYCLEYSLDDYLRTGTLALQNTVESDQSLNALKFAAGCIFDLELGSDMTFRNELVKGLKRDEVLNYVERLWKAVQILSKSPDLKPGLSKLVKAVHERLRAVDWNILSTKMYAMIINSRSRSLEVDIEGLFQALMEFEMTYRKGYWKYSTGQWPSMEKFVENVVKTIKSDMFWDRLDLLYVNTLNQFKATYDERKLRLETYMDLLRSAIKAMIEKVEYISKTVDETIVDNENKINALEIEEMLKAMVGGPAMIATKHFMACYVKNHRLFDIKPDVKMLDSMVSKELTGALYDLVFFNWPQDEIIPQGLDRFIETFISSFWLIISSLFGSCP